MKIIVIEGVSDYQARFELIPEGWQAGDTIAEAVGRLVMSQQRRLGFTVEFQGTQKADAQAKPYRSPEETPDRLMHNMEKKM